MPKTGFISVTIKQEVYAALAYIALEKNVSIPEAVKILVDKENGECVNGE